ncbi:MAG TPA: hypothetical protein VK582_24805 [Pyrinomonadaceae bacterium]|nr:hypothetical protein [Pyrinomonadaceae bacterium]
MKRVVISILLATVFASFPVFAESSEARPNGFGAEVISTNPAEAPAPQFRRRHRRRRYVFVRRQRGRRHMRVMRRRGRRR